MRPIPIPDHMVPTWGVRKVIAPPDGDLFNETISAVEAIVSVPPDSTNGAAVYTMLIKIDPDDMDAIHAAGDCFLLTMEGGVVPFGLGVLTIEDG